MNFGMWWAASVALGASVSVGPGDDLSTLTASLQPGDVVLFQAGTYTLGGTVYWTGQGTVDNPITMRAAEDAMVVLQNTGGGYVAQIDESAHIIVQDLIFEGDDNAEYNGVSGLLVSNSTDVTVQNCIIRNVWNDALRIDGNNTTLTVRNNHIFGSGNGTGIEVGCGDASCWMADGLIEFNHVHDIAGSGIYLHPGSQDNVVQHNNVYRVGGDGIYVADTQFGPQNIIYGNAFWEVEDDGMQLEGAALVQNNIVFECGGNGIISRDNDSDGLGDLRISHNTIVRTDGYAVELEDWYFRDGLVFANNAVSNPIGLGLYWYDEMQDDYYGSGTNVDTSNYIRSNVVTGLVDGFDNLAPGRTGFILPGGGVSDFENLDNFDFYPSPSSELRDNGDPSGEAYLPAEDFNGTPRDGASPDVGAYEYDGQGNPGWTLQEDFKEFGLEGRTGGPGVQTGCCGNKSSGTGTAALFLPLLGLGVAVRRRRRDEDED